MHPYYTILSIANPCKILRGHRSWRRGLFGEFDRRISVHRGFPCLAPVLSTCAPKYYYTADCFARAAANKIDLAVHRRNCPYGAQYMERLSKWSPVWGCNICFPLPNKIWKFSGAWNGLVLISSQNLTSCVLTSYEPSLHADNERETAGHSIEDTDRHFRHSAGVHFGVKWMLSDGVLLRYPVLSTCDFFKRAGEGYNGAHNGDGGSLNGSHRLTYSRGGHYKSYLYYRGICYGDN